MQLLGAGEIHLSNKMILGLIITIHALNAGTSICMPRMMPRPRRPRGLFWGVNTKQSSLEADRRTLEEILSERWQSGCEYGHHVLATNALRKLNFERGAFPEEERVPVCSGKARHAAAGSGSVVPPHAAQRA